MSDQIDTLNQRIDHLTQILQQILTNNCEYGIPSAELVKCFDLDVRNGYYVEEIEKMVETYVKKNKISEFPCMFEKNDAGFYPDNHLLSVFKPNRYFNGLPAMTWDKVHTEIVSNLSTPPDVLSRSEQLKFVRSLLR